VEYENDAQETDIGFLAYMYDSRRILCPHRVPLLLRRGRRDSINSLSLSPLRLPPRRKCPSVQLDNRGARGEVLHCTVARGSEMLLRGLLASLTVYA